MLQCVIVAGSAALVLSVSCGESAAQENGTAQERAAVHEITAARTVGSEYGTEQSVREGLNEATEVLRTDDDGPASNEDVACDVVLKLGGRLRTVPRTPGVVQTRGEVEAILDLAETDLVVVDAIEWCGNRIGSVDGCTSRGTAIVQDAYWHPANRGPVWAHELGHAFGINGHRDAELALMSSRGGPDHRRVSEEECAVYRSGPKTRPQGEEDMDMGIARSLAAALGASVITASAPAAGQETETIETLVTGQYAHGLPAGEVRRFAGTENTAILVAILRDPAAGPHHPNAAEALGLVGGPETAEILMAVADSVTDLSDQPRIAGAARRSALRALGMLAARHPAEAAEIVRHLESAALPGGSDADAGTGDVETAATVGLTLAASPGADAALCRIAGTVGAHPRVRAAARAHIHGAKTERNACPPALRGTQRAAKR